jgi:2-polyprenyl-6-methoxyphenol hydroxylase-like FAD-dependent oxidoreductase
MVPRRRYDVIVAGARCAGASTAMLLARRGLQVLVVDPARYGSDTLSTHALMRGGVLQLHRWGLLDAIRASDTPRIRTTTFHYGTESIEVAIRERDGIDALYAPRRTVLDPLLVDAASTAGAHIVHRHAVVDLKRGPDGRIRGASIAGADRRAIEVDASLVIGADGIHSRVARLLGADIDHAAAHASAAIYGHWRGVGMDGYHWFYEPGVSVGCIPTNDGETCVFVSLPRHRFENERDRGLETLYLDALRHCSRELDRAVRESDGPGKLRAFAGEPGFLRRSAGPGWALVGDAGYFRDPITAHGITDALRDAELLARAILEGADSAIANYQAQRDALVRPLLDVTDRISSFEWELDEVRDLHLALSREMKNEVDLLLTLDSAFAGTTRLASRSPAP